MQVRHRDYFGALADDARMLHEHGFAGWPDSDEVVRYACGIEDGLHALAGALGVELERSPRGRWIAVPCRSGKPDGPEPPEARGVWGGAPSRRSCTAFVQDRDPCCLSEGGNL